MFPSSRETTNPGTMRNDSGTVVAAERRISPGIIASAPEEHRSPLSGSRRRSVRRPIRKQPACSIKPPVIALRRTGRRNRPWAVQSIGAVADTDATPSTALVRILSTVQVWVNGVAQDGFFAGLTPGQFGLYRSILGRTGHTSAGRRSEYRLANGRQNGVGAREDKPRPITLTQVMGSRC